MTYRYVYKITCTEGRFKNKFYYGQHTTTNLDDGYKGSGSLLLDYYKKYPNDYIKEIIAFYNTQEELNIAEHDIIEPYLGTNNCLNLKGGGDKGELTEEYKQRISNTLKGRKRTIESRIKQSKSTKGRIGNRKGTHHTEETKRKLSESMKGIPCPSRAYSRKQTEEVKNKISESQKNRYKENPEISKKHSEYKKQWWINKRKAICYTICS